MDFHSSEGLDFRSYLRKTTGGGPLPPPPSGERVKMDSLPPPPSTVIVLPPHPRIRRHCEYVLKYFAAMTSTGRTHLGMDDSQHIEPRHPSHVGTGASIQQTAPMSLPPGADPGGGGRWGGRPPLGRRDSRRRRGFLRLKGRKKGHWCLLNGCSTPFKHNMAINILKSCKFVFAYVKNRSSPSHIRS